MGVFDKIKNALFEEEYVEVEEKPKKVKKNKMVKEKEPEKPIAKKVVLPDKKERVKDLEEEELNSDNYEFRPKDDIDKNELLEKRNNFKMMDDEDFKVDDEITDDGRELRIEPVIREDEIEVISSRSDDIPKREKKEYDYSYDDDFKEEKFDSYKNNYSFNEPYKEKKSYVDDINISKDNVKSSYNNDYSFNKSSNERTLYGMSNNQINVHEYGTYERKEEKTYFRPSPIISPIYGILDKNYKKEDVVSKKENRVSSPSFSRDRVSIDDIRKKAFGTISDDLEESFKDEEEVENTNSYQFDHHEEENLLVDLSDDNDKPTVKEVTMGDALEYFEDLGLEYNVDYVDDSKNTSNKVTRTELHKDIEIEEPVKDKEETKVHEEKHEEKQEEKQVRVNNIEVVKDNNKSTNFDDDDDDDDNLFDLIDSMYQE